MQLSNITLSSIILDPNSNLVREGAPNLAKLGSQWEFDVHTLVYDVFYRENQTIMICPPLRNLWPVLRDGLMIDEKRPKLKRVVKQRFETITITGSKPKSITFQRGDNIQSIDIGSDLLDDFKGERCLVSMIKDEPIAWIKDWIRWHVVVHGTESLVLFDNNSKSLDLDLLAAEVSEIEGLNRAVFVRAPFPYGAPAGGRFRPPAMFLQVAMLNLARRRMLARASSVLSIDVDELVKPLSGSSIYEHAENSLLGLASFKGKWVYSTPSSGPTSHRDHTQSQRNGGECRNTKWCIVPSSLSDSFPWNVHRPGGMFFSFSRTSARYWHFRSVSTGWNRSAIEIPVGLENDQELITAVREVLIEPADCI